MQETIEGAPAVRKLGVLAWSAAPHHLDRILFAIGGFGRVSIKVRGGEGRASPQEH